MFLTPYIKEHPYWFTLLVAVVLTGVVILSLYLAKVSPFYSNKGSKVKFQGDLSTASRGGNRSTPPTDLRDATESERTAFNAQGGYKVSTEGPDRWTYENNLFHDRFHYEQKLHGYREQDASAFVATLTNVSGEYYNMYITLNQDFFRKGFANSIGEQVTDATAETNINDMITLHKATDATKMILLQGVWDARPSSTGARKNTKSYQFNVDTPITTQLNNNIATNAATLDSVQLTSQQRAGSLRTAVRFVDYTIQLTATDSTTIRVYISDADHKMADKAVLINGVPQFYDFVSNTMVTQRSDNTTSFWNGQQAVAALFGTENETNNDPYRTKMSNAFSENLVGIPIVLTNEFNTGTLKTLTSANQLQFNLANSPSVLFSGILNVPGVTASTAGAFLANNPKYQIATFDIPDIALTASLTII